MNVSAPINNNNFHSQQRVSFLIDIRYEDAGTLECEVLQKIKENGRWITDKLLAKKAVQIKVKSKLSISYHGWHLLSCYEFEICCSLDFTFFRYIKNGRIELVFIALRIFISLVLLEYLYNAYRIHRHVVFWVCTEEAHGFFLPTSISRKVRASYFILQILHNFYRFFFMKLNNWSFLNQYSFVYLKKVCKM